MHTWTLKKRLEKKLDGNDTRMLQAILNKSWWQFPTKHQLYGHLPPITKTIQVRRARQTEHCWRSKDELISDVLLQCGRAKAGPPAITDIQHRIRDVAQKTCQRRWTIGKSGERGSGISVQTAWHDDIYILYPLYSLNSHKLTQFAVIQETNLQTLLKGIHKYFSTCPDRWVMVIFWYGMQYFVEAF